MPSNLNSTLPMASGESDDKFKAKFSGDRATAPTGLEDGNADTWQEFVHLQTGQVPLAPETGTSTRGLDHLPRLDQVLSALESTMALARRSERACPLPAHWQRLHALLPLHAGASAPAPVSEKEWKRVTPMQKRLLLRDHLEWAAATGVLPAVHALLEGLAETDWEHF